MVKRKSSIVAWKLTYVALQVPSKNSGSSGYHKLPYRYSHDSLWSCLWATSNNHSFVCARRHNGGTSRALLTKPRWDSSSVERQFGYCPTLDENECRLPPLWVRVCAWWLCISSVAAISTIICANSRKYEVISMFLWTLPSNGTCGKSGLSISTSNRFPDSSGLPRFTVEEAIGTLRPSNIGAS